MPQKPTQTETAETPTYVVRGEWKDPKFPNPMCHREHPYGMTAWTDRKGDEWRIYPSREAAKADGCEYASET
jgi:hypothetical protein